MKCTDRNCPQYGGEAAHCACLEAPLVIGKDWLCRRCGHANLDRRDCWKCQHPLMNRLETDQRTVAERKWNAPTMGKAAQKRCDVGLFSDDSKQGKLI